MNRPNVPISVPALDLKAQYATIRDEVERAVLGVLESQYFILGPEVSGLETEVAAYCGTKEAVGCASGSDALLLPLMAWGIGPGDEVITSPYTFFATGGAVWRTGAKPVFVDIDPETFNIDPAAIEKAITPATKALIPVHLYGQTAEMDAVNEIARAHGLAVLEDAAQAIGAEYEGKRAGRLGHAAALSFYPSKNLGGFGDAGMIVTDDADLAKRLRRLRVHGMEPKYHHHEVGFNSRLDALQAAVLRVKLRHLDQWTEARRGAAETYAALFEEEGLGGILTPPATKANRYHVFNQYVIRVPADVRDPLRAHLASLGVGTEIYYPIPLHLQVCFSELGHAPGDFPCSEQASAETVALPIYPELSEDAIRHVVGTIGQFLRGRAGARQGGERAA